IDARGAHTGRQPGDVRRPGRRRPRPLSHHGCRGCRRAERRLAVPGPRRRRRRTRVCVRDDRRCHAGGGTMTRQTEIGGARVAVVTGAVRGIGFAVARRLVRDGYAVACIDIDPGIVERGREIGATGFVADVSDALQVERAFADVRVEVGPVDVLVNNAALVSVHRPWESVTPDDWDRVMAVNARSMFLCAREAVTDMRAGSWGRIVNVSSVTVGLGARNLIDYVSSK